MGERSGRGSAHARRGYVIVAVLIVIVVLSLAAYQFTDLMTAEYRAAVRTNDAVQARLSAVSGAHYAAAYLANAEMFYGELGGNPYDNAGYFSDITVRPDPGAGRLEGRFSIVTAVNTGGGNYETRYGVTDEAGKLNINALIQLDPTGQVLYDALMMLPNMTEDVADAVVDWVDADDDPRTAGAESSYYQSLEGRYMAKNGALNSLDELLLVKGMTPQLLFGTDRNRNGLPDDDPNGGSQFDRGWAEYLTAYGRELNVDAAGALRIYLDQDDMQALYDQLQQAVGAELATYIVAYKTFQSVSTISTSSVTLSSGTTSGGGTVTITATTTNSNQQNTQAATLDQLTAALNPMLQEGATSRRKVGTSRNNYSLLSLVNTRITLPAQPAEPGQPPPPTYVYDCPLNDPNKLAELLPALLDKTTARAEVEMTPRLNVNTAPREVLMTLTGITSGSGTPLLTEEDVDNLIAQRDGLDPADPSTISGAWLLTVAKLSPDTFRNLEKYVTGRTMVYRIQSIGYFGQGGPVARVEAVVDINQGAPRFLYFRDLTDLDNPRGFEPPR